jgi:ornithine cyclodeaminase
MTLAGFRVFRAKTAKELALACNLIITATAAREPLLHLEDVQPGTHITALGADAPGKQELDPKLFQRADLIAVDSKSQCLDHGETSHPFQAGLISKSDIVELGEIIIDVGLARKSDSQVTIADLTGLGVQDIQIAKAVLAL